MSVKGEPVIQIYPFMAETQGASVWNSNSKSIGRQFWLFATLFYWTYIYYINQLLQPPCDMRPSQITTFSLICSWNNCFRRLNREYWTLSIAQVVMLKPMRHNCFYASKQSGSKLRLSEDRWHLSGICRNSLTTSDHVCGGKIDMGVK